MKCKGCNENKKLIKAHIIPESFFVSMKSGNKPLKVITNILGVYPKKSPIGIYDRNILCRECENRFQKIDDYAFRILIAEEDKQIPVYNDDVVVGYQLNNVDVSRLKLFFISILWRASISEQPFFSKINLGELEDKAKSLIWNESSGGADDFSFVLAKFDNVSGNVSKTIMDPHPEIWFGANCYRFYFYGYILYIKADLCETPNEWKGFIPDGNDLIIVSRGRVEDSKEFPIFIDAIRMQKT
ncbi:hypothetical protein LT068_17525 [Vibrio cholerae]|uniref:hypothetical protein n=1 Tax=Vibrio cholerae TaxID=666 RepID=UPI001E2F7212|nr:hypothetical protein [Vibrio cholerae]MCD6670830.1 hypothetical protein [Vibrio cholerae]